jgi:hypothetical protein
MKTLFILLLSLIFTNSILAQTKVKFNKETHDFGNISEGNFATHEFTITNLGKEPIIIRNVQPSCGCISPHFTQSPILSGKSGLIKATYNSTGRVGTFEKNLNVIIYPSDSIRVLKIKGNVMTKETYVPSIVVEDTIKNNSITNNIEKVDVCKEIYKEVDEFNGEVKWQADVTSDLSFIKYKRKGNNYVYYLSIKIRESGIYYGDGVTIILQNGIKINKPNEKVESDYLGGDFYSRAFITLTSKDIELLKKSGISKYKLYISKDELPEEFKTKCKDLFNCLVKSK